MAETLSKRKFKFSLASSLVEGCQLVWAQRRLQGETENSLKAQRRSKVEKKWFPGRGDMRYKGRPFGTRE
jgi:hypothetical protein